MTRPRPTRRRVYQLEITREASARAVTALTLAEKHVVSMAGLAAFPALRTLNLAANDIAAIEGLENCTVTASCPKRAPPLTTVCPASRSNSKSSRSRRTG